MLKAKKVAELLVSLANKRSMSQLNICKECVISQIYSLSHDQLKSIIEMKENARFEITLPQDVTADTIEKLEELGWCVEPYPDTKRKFTIAVPFSYITKCLN